MNICSRNTKLEKIQKRENRLELEILSAKWKLIKGTIICTLARLLYRLKNQKNQKKKLSRAALFLVSTFLPSASFSFTHSPCVVTATV
ncbi:hypothetical protein AYI70_g8685 [Smittium culicis]|uniref:Uncharacterized protein n=1 Tax=Smittium culicis TaxID=133412 RepID=A0A1R1XET0_9FUNG|nr:hypothetical protein AYI70_g8685 [Smittium culicis]